MEINLPQIITSPFGGNAKIVQTMPVSVIEQMYQRKCGVDISSSFNGIPEVGLYQCEITGYKFWRPEHITGNETFYKMLSAAWPNYYRIERWEHTFAHKYLKNKNYVLEIGSGPGHFLKTLEGDVTNAMGIELNTKVISEKVTKFQILPTSMELLSEKNEYKFDAIYAFQVLEHILNPYSLIKSSLKCLAEGGLLIFSTPNNDYSAFKNQTDAFDLPPHHIGVFNPLIYEKIGKLFDLQIVEIILEKQTSNSSLLKKLSGNNLLKYFPLLKPKTGPNIIVVYKKK